MPRVSVIMPVYNMANDIQILEAAVESISRQTCQDWELILYDDGSTDHTLTALKQIAEKDDRTHLICSRKNRGAGYARNVCIQAASGKYVAVMDADDLSFPQRVEIQADFLDQHPEYALVGCNVLLMDGNGIWGERRLEERPHKTSFLYTLPFVHPSVMLRLDVVRKVHGYSNAWMTRRAEDYDLLMRLYAYGYQGYNIQKPLLCYREDLRSYGKRTYQWRIQECRVRCQGFRKLGILKGNFRYVLKPLVAGMIPARIMLAFRRRKYRIRKSRNQQCVSSARKLVTGKQAAGSNH